MLSPSTMMTIFWGVLFVAFVIAETATVQLICIWLAAGSLASFLVSFFVPNIMVQTVIFVVVSTLLLVFTRPLLKKFITPKRVKTNADSLVGREAIVSQTIDNLRGTGRIMADGLSWNARSDDPGTVIAPNEVVVISRIEGVTAFVSRQETISE